MSPEEALEIAKRLEADTKHAERMERMLDEQEQREQRPRDNREE